MNVIDLCDACGGEGCEYCGGEGFILIREPTAAELKAEPEHQAQLKWARKLIEDLAAAEDARLVNGDADPKAGEPAGITAAESTHPVCGHIEGSSWDRFAKAWVCNQCGAKEPPANGDKK
jgi:hypothetical protein